MTDRSQPAIPRNWAIGIGVLYALYLGYAVLVAGSVLLGVLPALLLPFLYVSWRFLVAFEAIARSLQRIADDTEQDD